MPITTQIKKAWNAFKNDEETKPDQYSMELGISTSNPPQRTRGRVYNEKTIIGSLYTRVAIDVAGIEFKHVKLDDRNRYMEDMASALNDCFTLEPNMDQGPRAFRQNIVATLFDHGVAAIVPVDAAVDPTENGRFDIYSLRVGQIMAWYPSHVKVRLYNEKKGILEDILLEKSFIAIVENPLYDVMNEPNSTLQRLTRKLQILDAIDEQSGSGKLDIIIQLPYVIKSDARQKQAEKRRDDIQTQLRGSQYGIAYTDGTEKITQLNRPAENNIMGQIEFLTEMLYDQLGITKKVMDGTADEAEMLNYKNRTLEPILDAIAEAFQRSFLGLLGTRRKERIKYFSNPFKLIPLSEMAIVADKLSRNEIVSPNELRDYIGMPPSDNPKADELHNSNMPSIPPVAIAPKVPLQLEAAPEVEIKHSDLPLGQTALDLMQQMQLMQLELRQLTYKLEED